ncbi:MAG: hypothetical protein KF729_36155 [Sandaracinaceae bacterium]|nr:hypothetical protein [Sandaracinaceae bacterium]
MTRESFGWWVAAIALVALGCDGGGGADAGIDGGAPLDGGGIDAGPGEGDAGPGRDAGACAAGEELCDGACRRLDEDPEHCGACGEACDGTEICDEGACACPSDRTRCGEICVDTDTDAVHCGACDDPCGAGQVCAGGECEDVCAAPRRSCVVDDGGMSASICVDPATDPDHCGECGTVCRLDQVCGGGSCRCGAGRTECGGQCVDLTSNPEFCGTCLTTCRLDQSCEASACVCTGGLTECGGSCVNTQVSNAHCGRCNMPCGAGTSCSAGACTSMCASMPGTTFCSGSCVDTQISNAHCGGCGNACGGGRCDAGVCRPPNATRETAIDVVFPAGGGELTVTGTTAGSFPVSGPCGCTSGPGVWYRVGLSEPVVFYADTFGSSFDSSVFLTGATGAPLEGAGRCSDDSGCAGADNRNGQIATVLAAGTYYLVVSGCGSGAFTLHVQHFRIADYASVALTPIATAPATTFAQSATLRLQAAGSRAFTPHCSLFGRSGERVHWLTSCGTNALPSIFSLCPADGGYWEYGTAAASYDPVLVAFSGVSGGSLACVDDVPNCASSQAGAPTSSRGARIEPVLTRGLNWLVIDERNQTAGGMEYRFLHATR